MGPVINSIPSSSSSSLSGYMPKPWRAGERGIRRRHRRADGQGSARAGGGRPSSSRTGAPVDSRAPRALLVSSGRRLGEARRSRGEQRGGGHAVRRALRVCHGGRPKPRGTTPAAKPHAGAGQPRREAPMHRRGRAQATAGRRRQAGSLAAWDRFGWPSPRRGPSYLAWTAWEASSEAPEEESPQRPTHPVHFLFSRTARRHRVVHATPFLRFSPSLLVNSAATSSIWHPI